MEKAIAEPLRENGHDFIIIYGCTQGFYRRLKTVDSCPDYLLKSPFNVDPDSDDEDVPTREKHNRDVFFFQPLSDKYEKNIMKPAENSNRFSFELSDYLKGYYGIDESEEGAATDENNFPNVLGS
jgi:hypothetical protein